MSGSKQFFEDILQLYTNRSSEWLTALLNSDRFIQAVNRVLIASFEFRDFLQKTIQAAFEQVNIPTREDVERIIDRQRDLEYQVLSLEEALERIETKLDGLAVRKKAARRKPARSAETEAER